MIFQHTGSLNGHHSMSEAAKDRGKGTRSQFPARITAPSGRDLTLFLCSATTCLLVNKYIHTTLGNKSLYIAEILCPPLRHFLHK